MGVQFYIRIYMFIILYIDFLSQSVFSHVHNVHNVQYKRTFGNINKNDILCGVQKNENKIVAVKMVQSDENSICVGLERDWLLNKAFETGYDYIEKSEVLDIFNPPVAVESTQNRFQWIFPASFDVGAVLTISITIPTSFTVMSMNIFDTVKDILKISPDVSEIVVLHLVFHHTYNYIVANRHIPSSGWGTEILKQPCPMTGEGLHIVTFESQTDYIKVIIDGKGILNFPHDIHPKQGATLQIAYGNSDPILVESIRMKGSA